ncbi:unnamed protein product [Trichogramma brassicae]|uniref:Uncharacterized protein n=1 Tax=Trichogramma brassicae TaxID=86971 RepID=A0A6H5ISP0_9HYME|nr:unnamed protein product [Trichogramma brassicae]
MLEALVTARKPGGGVGRRSRHGGLCGLATRGGAVAGGPLRRLCSVDLVRGRRRVSVVPPNAPLLWHAAATLPPEPVSMISYVALIMDFFNREQEQNFQELRRQQILNNNANLRYCMRQKTDIDWTNQQERYNIFNTLYRLKERWWYENHLQAYSTSNFLNYQGPGGVLSARAHERMPAAARRAVLYSAARTARDGGSSGGSGEPLLESRPRSGADPSEAEKRRRSAELGVTYTRYTRAAAVERLRVPVRTNPSSVKRVEIEQPYFAEDLAVCLAVKLSFAVPAVGPAVKLRVVAPAVIPAVKLRVVAPAVIPAVKLSLARLEVRERMALAPEELALYWALVKVGDLPFRLFVVVGKLLLPPHVLVDVWAPLGFLPLPEVGELLVLRVELESECVRRTEEYARLALRRAGPGGVLSARAHERMPAAARRAVLYSAARTARDGGSSGGSGEPLLESRPRSGADPSEAEKRRRSAELGVTYSACLIIRDFGVYQGEGHERSRGRGHGSPHRGDADGYGAGRLRIAATLHL